ncbi:unnamed protein product [Mytilus coruscus]|uniref:Uncharacterized protein n=1 Tax=Mytilus coruscus TaxID=42192 RepID=A0A6J8EJG6_MYTCO|nr:unnamed protein product [Mytilus coruscus]
MGVHSSFNLQCPVNLQREIRAKERCNVTSPEFMCLLDDNTKEFRELCSTESKFQGPGFKLVIRGKLDRERCEKERYQPFIFRTERNTNCVFSKSNCTEEGQIISDIEDSSSDQKCRCDYTRGFDFVAVPKSLCYCTPSEEDCSCYLRSCAKHQVFTPDYTCISINDWTGKFICDEIEGRTYMTTDSGDSVKFEFKQKGT